MIDQTFLRDFEMLGASSSDNYLVNFLEYVSYDDNVYKYAIKLSWKNQ